MEKSKLPFKPYEIVKVKPGIKPEPMERHTLYKKDGTRFRAMLYTLPQIQGCYPYMRQLLNNHFMVCFEQKKYETDVLQYGRNVKSFISNNVGLVLLDDYRPFYYGIGYTLSIHSLDIFESTGKIEYDVRKMPSTAQKMFLNGIIREKLDTSRIKCRDNNIINKFEFYRRIEPKMFHRDLYTTYALLNVLDKRCNWCGDSLFSTHNTIIDLVENSKIKKVRPIIADYLGTSEDNKNLRIFPVGYICQCGRCNILVSTDRFTLDFSPFVVDTNYVMED